VSRRSPARRAGDRGTATAELVVLMVVFFTFVAAIVFAGRVTVGAAQVEAAARSAARTISIARDPEGTIDRARDQAATIAGLGTAACSSMQFTPVIDRSADPAEVRVEVACTVDLSEITLIAVPGSFTVDATAVEVIDRHREGS
jgi:Flp pilus assembly protein TadG